uniref:Uncharacterized protein n=1 Tax=Bionectria ochroleuca TaxID=29856 RepID=A0A8H7MZU2_BIOOC
MGLPDPGSVGAQFAIIGYGPISTNAVGRQIVADKAPLPPPEKQAFYDAVQPDVQLESPAPPSFIVYSNNDPVVPVVNAYRLAEGITKSGGLSSFTYLRMRLTALGLIQRTCPFLAGRRCVKHG